MSHTVRDMQAHNIHNLSVANEYGTLVGFVSATDIDYCC